jgi:hypothetical protein
MGWTTIETDGFANKVHDGGKFFRFDLANTRTDKKTGEKTKTYFRVTGFPGSSTIPGEGDIVSVKGKLEVTVTEKDGKKYTNLNVVASEITVTRPGKAKDAPTAEASNPDDPF